MNLSKINVALDLLSQLRICRKQDRLSACLFTGKIPVLRLTSKNYRSFNKAELISHGALYRTGPEADK
jgi:hypothetical protein